MTLHEMGFDVGTCELPHRVAKRALQELRHLGMIAMCTSRRLTDQPVDQAQSLESVRCDAKGFCCVRRTLGGLPQDRRTAFGRDHRINAVLQHQGHVADADGQSATRATLPDDGGNDRYTQTRHLEQIASNRFGLTTLLSINARERARRIDKGHDRQTEFLSELHQPQRFTVPLGAWHAEIAVRPLFGVMALLMTNHHHRLAIESGHPTHDRGIIGKTAIPVQFMPVREHQPDVIEGVGPLRMACHLRDLPRRQLGVGVLDKGLALFLEPVDFVGDVDCRIILHKAKLFDLGFQLGDRLFKFQKSGFHPFLFVSPMQMRVSTDRCALSIPQAPGRGFATDTRLLRCARAPNAAPGRAPAPATASPPATSAGPWLATIQYRPAVIRPGA